MNPVKDDQTTRIAPLRPEPYLITPRDEFEARCGKATLVTNTQLDDIIRSLRKSTYDPDLMEKLEELRARKA